MVRSNVTVMSRSRLVADENRMTTTATTTIQFLKLFISSVSKSPAQALTHIPSPVGTSQHIRYTNEHMNLC